MGLGGWGPRLPEALLQVELGQLSLGWSHSFPAGAERLLEQISSSRAPSAFPEVPAVAPCQVTAPFCTKSSVFATEGKAGVPSPRLDCQPKGKPCTSCRPLRPPPRNLPMLRADKCKSLPFFFPCSHFAPCVVTDGLIRVTETQLFGVNPDFSALPVPV